MILVLTCICFLIPGACPSKLKHIGGILALGHGLLCHVSLHFTFRWTGGFGKVKIRPRLRSGNHRVCFVAHVHRTLLGIWSDTDAHAMVSSFWKRKCVHFYYFIIIIIIIFFEEEDTILTRPLSPCPIFSF